MLDCIASDKGLILFFTHWKFERIVHFPVNIGVMLGIREGSRAERVDMCSHAIISFFGEKPRCFHLFINLIFFLLLLSGKIFRPISLHLLLVFSFINLYNSITLQNIISKNLTDLYQSINPSFTFVILSRLFLHLWEIHPFTMYESMKYVMNAVMLTLPVSRMKAKNVIMIVWIY